MMSGLKIGHDSCGEIGFSVSRENGRVNVCAAELAPVGSAQ